MTNVQSGDGFKIKTSLYHGIRNFELLDGSGKNEQVDETLDFFDMESKKELLRNPQNYLKEDDGLR